MEYIPIITMGNANWNIGKLIIGYSHYWGIDEYIPPNLPWGINIFQLKYWENPIYIIRIYGV